MIRLPIALLALLPSLAAAQDTPPDLQSLLDQRAADCAGFENGALTVEEGAVALIDLDGDGAEEWVLDEAHLRCSSAASLFCGTGGCSLHLLVGDTLTSRLAKGWQVVDFPPFRTLLLQLHGTRCGGINPTPCIEALTWDPEAGRFSTIAPSPSTPLPAPAE